MEEFKKCSGGKKLKDYRHQKEIAGILEKMDERENFSTLVTVPTGAGRQRLPQISA